MKKILAVLLAMYFFVPASFGQEEEIRPAAIGVSFFLNDYLTANRIRTTSFSSVQANKQWAKTKEMDPGLAITYFKGVRRHVDFAGTLAGSFVDNAAPAKPNLGDKFLRPICIFLLFDGPWVPRHNLAQPLARTMALKALFVPH